MAARTHRELTLRRTTAADLPLLHAMELDRASNELAGTKPRDWSAFHERWTAILADPAGTRTGVTPRVVLEDGVVVGAVNIALQDGLDMLGYWIDRGRWGRGIATAAVALMLAEFPRRPLYATAAARNAASIRVLEKNGFVLLSRTKNPETARTVERESVTLVFR